MKKLPSRAAALRKAAQVDDAFLFASIGLNAAAGHISMADFGAYLVARHPRSRKGPSRSRKPRKRS